MTENAKRLVATIPADTFSKLDVLADGARFGGNRSAAVTWCIEIGAAVLADPVVRDRLFAGPADSLAAFAGSRKAAR